MDVEEFCATFPDGRGTAEPSPLRRTEADAKDPTKGFSLTAHRRTGPQARLLTVAGFIFGARLSSPRSRVNRRGAAVFALHYSKDERQRPLLNGDDVTLSQMRAMPRFQFDLRTARMRAHTHMYALTPQTEPDSGIPTAFEGLQTKKPFQDRNLFHLTSRRGVKGDCKVNEVGKNQRKRNCCLPSPITQVLPADLLRARLRIGLPPLAAPTKSPRNNYSPSNVSSAAFGLELQLQTPLNQV